MKHAIPGHLRPDTKRWLRQVLADFDLESQDFRVLVRTAEAWDRGEQAREIIAAEGLTIADRYGVAKAHPAVAIERDARLHFFRGIRELSLAGGDVPEAPRMARTPDYGRRA